MNKGDMVIAVGKDCTEEDVMNNGTSISQFTWGTVAQSIGERIDLLPSEHIIGFRINNRTLTVIIGKTTKNELER